MIVIYKEELNVNHNQHQFKNRYKNRQTDAEAIIVDGDGIGIARVIKNGTGNEILGYVRTVDYTDEKLKVGIPHTGFQATGEKQVNFALTYECA